MIRDKIWAAHVWMQTVSAYPNGPLPAATCHVRRAFQLKEGHDAYGLPAQVGDLLVLGPGTHAEIDALHAQMAVRSTTALTLSADELIGLRGFDVALGDMHDMPFKNGSFDCIFSSNVLEHAIAPHVALLECRRVLRKGGIFYAVVPTFDTPGGGCTPWHTYCLDQHHWAALLQKSGFAATILRASETLEGGAVESYWHIRAIATTPPWPHDEVLRRISEGKE